MRKNYKITIEYDGTDFVGWQRQPNGRSVQEEIENALHKIFSTPVPIVGSGRTDSGVHARGQVANFFLDDTVDKSELLRSLNGLVGEDVVIHSLEDADESFSARYSAKEREYQYFISRRATAIERKYCWQLRYDLDIALMNTAASSIVGENDFQAFCRAEANTEHFLCTVFQAKWDLLSNDKMCFTISANRFLHGMVRALVGTMVDVGRGFTSPEAFNKIFESKKRQNAGQSAPPGGLFLERVIY